MTDLIYLIRENAGIPIIAFFLITTFIEISPIKINPISSFAKWLGKCLNSETWEKLEKLNCKVEQLAEDVDINRVEQIRWEILNFANSCRNGNLHSKDEFTHVMQQYDKYERLIKKRGVTNGVIDEEYKYISELYNQCSHKNSFL